MINRRKPAEAQRPHGPDGTLSGNANFATDLANVSGASHALRAQKSQSVQPADVAAAPRVSGARRGGLAESSQTQWLKQLVPMESTRILKFKRHFKAFHAKVYSHFSSIFSMQSGLIISPFHQRKFVSLNAMHGAVKRKAGLKNGACFGLACLYAYSNLLGKGDSFLKNLYTASSQSRVFFDSVKNFQRPDNCGHNFYQILEQHDPLVFQKTSNPLCLNGVFSQDALTQLLSKAPKHLFESTSVFIMKSTTHAVALKPLKSGRWELYDPSATSASVPEKVEAARDLSERLFRALRGAYSDRGAQVALNVSLYTPSAEELRVASNLKKWCDSVPLALNPNGRSVMDLCNLAAESNDNKTLARMIESHTTGSERVLTSLTKIVDACGFYSNPPSLDKINLYKHQNPLKPAVEVASDLGCSVVDVFKAGNVRA